LNDAQPGDVLLEVGYDLGDGLAGVAKGSPALYAEDGRARDHDREDRERGEGEAPVDEEDRYEHPDQGKPVLDEVLNAVVKEGVEVLDVVRQARDDPTGLLL
jgi:hypothetical protein